MSDNTFRFLVLNIALPFWILQWVLIFFLAYSNDSLWKELRKLAPPSPSHKESRDDE